MRIIYSLLLYLLAPLIPFYLKKRGKKNPDYLKNWHERFSWKICNNSNKPLIWLHSVSVGETRAMQKMVFLLRERFPEYQLLITTMTPTGRATAKNLYPFVIVHYIPYDLDFCVRKFYQIFKPKIGIIMETEIWPNLIHYADKYKIPLYLVNARLSDRSYRGYQRFKYFILPIINKISAILCQDENSMNNFKKLDYNGTLKTIGNTKFDLTITKEIGDKIKQFKEFFSERKVITFASTRDGEEKLILDNISLEKDVLYLIVPRHPERFKLLEQLLIDKNINYQLRSQNQSILATTKVVIGDSMGEMLAYYAISYLVVIGGSINEFGGQNPLEAIFMDVPVIFGNSMFNFAEIAKNLLLMNCAKQFNNIQQLNELINKLLLDYNLYNELQQNCNYFIKKYQGASQAVIDNITENL